MKKILLLLIIISISYLFISPLNLNAMDEVSVKINKNNLLVDEYLTCEVLGIDKEEVFYKWIINDEVVSDTNSYKTTPNDYESFICVEIYKDDLLLSSDSVYFSLLPVIYINTINNEEITSREEYINGSMYIQGNYEYDSQYDGDIEIKGRGGSSWISPKKSFKLKLDKKTNLFGFGKSKHYVLLNNYQDLSLLRNKLAFDISSQFGLVTPDSELVQVILNGEYHGCYLLCEHIRIGSSLIDIEDYEELADDLAENICDLNDNVNLDDLKDYLDTNMNFLTDEYIEFNNVQYKVSDYICVPSNISGGFLYELTDNNKNENSSFITNKGIEVNVSKPEYISSNEEVFEIAKTIINDFEEAIYSADGYNSKGKHFTELCDIDSLASYFLTLEILGNEDAASRSRYCYIDQDGLLKFGPVWDFDISSNANKTIMSSNMWVTTSTIVSIATEQDIFKELTDDPIFQMKVYEKYKFIRPYLEYIMESDGLLDEYVNYSYLAGVKNEYLWVDSSNEIKRGYSWNYGDLCALRTYLEERIEWLDKELKSYDSTMNSLSSIYSSNQYKKSSKININISNNEININVPNGYESIIYLNGLKYTSLLTFTLSDEDLSKGVNTIEVIANKDNEIIRNYEVIEKDFTLCEVPSKEKCNHEYLDVEYQKVSKEDIGIIECKYCKHCHHYFDEEFNEISVEKVYTSDRTKTVLYGLKTTISGCGLILISLILSLIFIFNGISKRRKELRHGEEQ